MTSDRNKFLRADALVYRCHGWTADLERSGLSLIHLTVGRPHVSWEAVCDQITAAWSMLSKHRDHMFPVGDPEDLDRIGTPGRVGVIFGLQNASQLGEQVDRVDALWRLGIRVLQPTYNDANLLGDGCAESRNAPLSRLGRRVVEACNKQGIVFDLSHVGPNSSLDAAACSSQPVVATHSNRHSLVQNPRNKLDSVLRAIAGTGGVVGVSPWGPMCWRGDPKARPTIDDFVAQLLGMLDLIGDEAVAIGTDLPALATSASPGGRRDGSTVQASLDDSLARFPEIFGPFTSAFGNNVETRYCVGFDSLETWRILPNVLSEKGLSDLTIRKVLAENWLRVCRQVWGSGTRIATSGSPAPH
jgi:membrane dipeptidase